jgi:hypothetical protein
VSILSEHPDFPKPTGSQKSTTAPCKVRGQARWCSGSEPDGAGLLHTALDVSSGRGCTVLVDARFPGIGSAHLRRSRRIHHRRKGFSCIETHGLGGFAMMGRVMALTRRQPLRRSTVAPTEFTAIDVGPGAPVAEPRSASRGSATRELW